MKIDFSPFFLDLQGRKIVEGSTQQPIQLKTVAIDCLLTEDRAASGAEKFERWNFAQRIQSAEDITQIEFTIEEVAKIKESIGKNQPHPIISGQAWKFLES